MRAASYGFTLGGAVGLAMIEGGDEVVDQKYLDAGTWEVEIAGKRYPAIAVAQAALRSRDEEGEGLTLTASA